MKIAEELRNALNSNTNHAFTEQYNHIIKLIKSAVHEYGNDHIKIKDLRKDVAKHLMEKDGFKIEGKVEGDREDGQFLYTISIPETFSIPASHNQPD